MCVLFKSDLCTIDTNVKLTKYKMCYKIEKRVIRYSETLNNEYIERIYQMSS